MLRGQLDATLVNLTTALNTRTYTGPWVRVEGFAQVACGWVSVGGATITATVEESFDGTTADRSTSAGAAAANGPAVPTVVTLVGQWCRMKLVGSVADTTTMKANMNAVG